MTDPEPVASTSSMPDISLPRRRKRRRAPGGDTTDSGEDSPVFSTSARHAKRRDVQTGGDTGGTEEAASHDSQ